MLQKVQGRIRYGRKKLFHQCIIIPPGNQENMEENKKGGWGGIGSVSKYFSNIQQQGSIKELTILLRGIVWRLELKMT